MDNMPSSYLTGLVLFLLLTVQASAQRHGRPDSAQNYMKYRKPLSAELGLKFETTHKWIYFHLSDLRKMERTTMRATDPTTGGTTTYQGVSLSELVPDGLADHKFEVFEDSWGFRDKRVLSEDGVNAESELIVADTIDGKRLAGNAPFCFVVKNKRGDMIVVKKLVHIRVMPAQ